MPDDQRKNDAVKQHICGPCQANPQFHYVSHIRLSELFFCEHSRMAIIWNGMLPNPLAIVEQKSKEDYLEQVRECFNIALQQQRKKSAPLN